MQNLLNDLKELLKNDDRLMVGDDLLKNKIIELSLKLDKDLIKLLLSHEQIKRHFFTDIDGTLVFDKDKFMRFVSNKAFLPDSYTSFKNKIGLTVDGDYLSEGKEVVLAWPYKDCVLEGGQTREDAKRKEIFWNEILAPDEIDRLLDPKVLTSFKRIDKKGEHKVSEIKDTDNLIIKGNNLLALHSIKKRFAGRIKFIYIDPPFNREADTFYNDSFKHSTWLTFIKNRFHVASKLLTSDGVICVHIDDEEYAYLKVLMDDIFGRDNFVNTICVRDSHPSGLKLANREKTIIKTKSYIIVYRKSSAFHLNPLYQRRYDWDTHFNTFVDIGDSALPKYNLKEYVIKRKIVGHEFNLDENALRDKRFRNFAFQNRDKIYQSTKEIPKKAKELSLNNPDTVIEYNHKGIREFAFNGRRLSPLSKSIWNVGFDGYYKEDFGKLLCDFWDDIDFNNSQNEGGVSLPRGKKPELLLARLISLFTSKNDIVLDFYLGCGTTNAVAHKMGRQYVGIEQLDYGKNNAVVRLVNVINGDKTGISKEVNFKGGGYFIYCELMKWNELYIERIQQAKSKKELQQIWETMKEKAFLSYKVDHKQFDENAKEFGELSVEDQKKFLIEVLDKNQLYVNLSEIDDSDYKVSEEDKKLNRQFYNKY